jgi:hypothetical protein
MLTVLDGKRMKKLNVTGNLFGESGVNQLAQLFDESVGRVAFRLSFPNVGWVLSKRPEKRCLTLSICFFALFFASSQVTCFPA